MHTAIGLGCRYFCLVLLSPLSVAVAGGDAEAQMRGYWQEPLGAIVEVYSCADGLCLRIAQFAPGAHPHTDQNNPDPTLRARSLCGLLIGQGFVASDRQHAAGGHLYDPRSGQTYRGALSAEGNLLRLRGYVGIPLLGRTAVWTRVERLHVPCASS
jgi:uncharacterized protein (DUF2147 family)